jgi:hypothetical protein
VPRSGSLAPHATNPELLLFVGKAL